MRGELTIDDRQTMLDWCQTLIDDDDDGEIGVTYEQLEAMSDEDLIAWVETWNKEETPDDHPGFDTSFRW